MDITHFKCPCCGTDFEIFSDNEEQRRELIAELQVNCNGCRLDRLNDKIIARLKIQMEWAFANPSLAETVMRTNEARDKELDRRYGRS